MRALLEVGVLGGTAARASARPGSAVIERPADPGEAVDTLNRIGAGYALSGQIALGEIDAPYVVLYCDDVQRVTDALRTLPSKPGTTMVIIPKDPDVDGDVVQVGGVYYTAPERALVDMYASGGRMPDLADQYAEAFEAARRPTHRVRTPREMAASRGLTQTRPQRDRAPRPRRVGQKPPRSAPVEPGRPDPARDAAHDIPDRRVRTSVRACACHHGCMFTRSAASNKIAFLTKW